MSNLKFEFYQSLRKQLQALLSGEGNWLTNISQFGAFLNTSLEEINWVGFYLSQANGDLLLGPFQGNVACVHISYGKGVCGTAAAERQVQVVKDVDQFEGHIACDVRSRSEIVLPVILQDYCFGVLDIDSPNIGRFDSEDANGLQELVKVLIEATDWPLNS